MTEREACIACKRDDIPTTPLDANNPRLGGVACAHVASDGSLCLHGSIRFREKDGSEQRALFEEMLDGEAFAPDEDEYPRTNITGAEGVRW